MENSIDGETDCEKCPTGRCLLLDKRDTQTIVPDAGDDGNEGDDEDDDDDNDTNNHEDDEKVSDDENRQNLINPNDAIFCQQSQNVNNGSIQNIEHHSGNQNNLTNSNRAHKNNVNTSFSNLEQQGDNNSLDQVKPSESHNHSINGVNDLAVKLKRFSRISQDKRLKKSDIDEPTVNGKLNQASFKFDGASYPNGVLTTSNNNKINNFLTSNLTNNKITCVCNGKSDNAKCIRRLISSDSGGSNKSSSKSGRRSRSGGPPQSPPDGGWGWVVVFASFMISLIADGVSLSYGFFQMDLSDHFGESKGKTALVGSLLLSMPALTGPIASALTDRYGCRSMTIVSGLLSASGFILGSFARKLEHLFIAFSITGIGLSLSYVTSIVIVAYYFNTKRSLATGLAVCGTGIGTFLFAPLTTYLLKEYSWRGTLLIMSGFFLNIIVFGALMKDINVSEFDSIDSQESDSDEDSVIESMNGHNSTLVQNNCCGAFVLGPCNGGKSDFNAGHNGAKGVICNESSIDINKNDFPLVPLSSTRKTANAEATCHCVGKLPHQLNSSSSKLNGSPNKPLSSNCINSHCSSMFPIDKQVTTTFFQNQPDHLHARNNHNLNHHNHQHQCNQVNHRLLRFQSSYSSSNPKSDLKNYSSLVNIPTYITTDDLISKDILDEISGRKDGNLNQLLQKYPNLLTIHNNREQEKSLFCSSRVIGRDQVKDREVSIPINDSRDVKLGVNGLPINSPIVKGNYGLDSKRRLKGDFEPVINRSTANRPKFVGGNNIGMVGTTGLGKEGLGLRMQRASLTYRTAVFRDVRRYRLRSSSAPDIFHNSMVTISERENFLCDIKQVLVDSVDLSIFKNIRFTIFCLSNLLLHGCIDVPYVYLPDHAISSGICVKEMATYLISVLGIANTLGTIIVGYIGDKPWLSPSTWYSGLTALGGISMALIPFVRNYYLLAVLAAFYGFSVSANYTLVSVILVDLISLDKFTNAYGLMLLVQGIASMLGPPIAGWLFDISGDYDTTFYVIGLCVFASGTIVFPLKESPSTSSPSASSSPSNGSSVIESTSRTSSPTEDKIAALSSNKTLFGKEPFP